MRIKILLLSFLVATNIGWDVYHHHSLKRQAEDIRFRAMHEVFTYSKEHEEPLQMSAAQIVGFVSRLTSTTEGSDPRGYLQWLERNEDSLGSAPNLSSVIGTIEQQEQD